MLANTFSCLIKRQVKLSTFPSLFLDRLWHSVKMLLFKKKKSNSVFLLVDFFQAPIPLTYRKGSTINLVIFMTAELP